MCILWSVLVLQSPQTKDIFLTYTVLVSKIAVIKTKQIMLSFKSTHCSVYLPLQVKHAWMGRQV